MNQHLLVVATDDALTTDVQNAVRAFAVDPEAQVRVITPDGDPMAEIAATLQVFPATELVIAAGPDVIDQALARFGLPTVPVVTAPVLVAA